MKRNVTTLQQALVFLLQGLVYTENKLKQDLQPGCLALVSLPIAEEMNNYSNASVNKLLKLHRVFNYLLCEPTPRKNEIVDSILIETNIMIDSAKTSFVRDIVAIGHLQQINAFKMAAYRTAYMLACELELDVAADLLQQILEWENEVNHRLQALAFNEIYKPHSSTLIP